MQRLAAFEGRNALPGLEAALGGSDRVVDIVNARKAERTDRFAGSGIEHRMSLRMTTFAPAAGDVQRRRRVSRLGHGQVSGERGHWASSTTRAAGADFCSVACASSSSRCWMSRRASTSAWSCAMLIGWNGRPRCSDFCCSSIITLSSMNARCTPSKTTSITSEVSVLKFAACVNQ